VSETTFKLEETKMKRRAFLVTSSAGLLATTGLTWQEKKLYLCPPCGCSADGQTFDKPGACPACGMTLIEKPADANSLTLIPAFLKLNEQIWTGGQPPLELLAKLQAEGVKVIINLRPHSEHNGEAEAAKAKELGLHYFNVPVVYNAPQAADADAFLKLTDEHLPDGRVFIHCAAAIRVGAFWLIRRVLRDGWTYERALEEANKIGLRDRPHLVEFARGYLAGKQKK
jgi:protein tyrosine phosphatase (PTP) superfamily phosphohydrolase (DUF442 family)